MTATNGAHPTTLSDPAPLIIIQPSDEAIAINAYDLTPDDVADALRLAILHVKAKTARVSFVETIVRQPRPAWAPRTSPVAVDPEQPRRRRQPVEIEE